MLKSIILTAALIAPNATETTAPAPEEENPVIIQDQETTEEAPAPTAAATEETPAPVEEAPTVEEAPETPQLYETPGGLTETAPTSDDTFSTPEKEYLKTVYDPEEVVFHSPEEENPETPPKYATPEEEATATGKTEETTAPTPEEIHLQWLATCETYEEYTPAPAAYDPPRKTTAPKYIPHDINASDITALNAPYFNRKPYQGVTVITCEY